jgi:uncharacterized membrane protein
VLAIMDCPNTANVHGLLVFAVLMFLLLYRLETMVRVLFLS